MFGFQKIKQGQYALINVILYFVKQIKELHDVIEKLIKKNKEQNKRIEELEKENEELKKKSNLSPLSDVTPSGVKPAFVKPETSGKKKKNKSKKDKERKGKGRSKPNENEINRKENHTLTVCPKCEGELEPPKSSRKRTTTDIDFGKVDVCEHTINKYWCKTCKEMVEPVVKDALANCVIGLKTTIYTAYQHFVYGMSLSKIQKDLKLKGLKVTTATLLNIWYLLSQHLKPEYETLKQTIRETKGKLHADETGFREKGKTHWVWLFSTKDIALFAIRKSRGGDVVLEILGEKFEGILTTDFWKAYLKVSAKFRQWCITHFLREFRKIEFRNAVPPPEYWLFKKKVKRLLRDALRFSRQENVAEKERTKAFLRFMKRLDEIVKTKDNYKDADVIRLINRMDKFRDGFFTFVLLEKVDPTNNHAERVIRFVVLLRKIQHHTMSKKGSETMEIMLSIFKTFELQGKEPVNETIALVQNLIEKEKYSKS